MPARHVEQTVEDNRVDRSAGPFELLQDEGAKERRRDHVHSIRFALRHNGSFSSLKILSIMCRLLPR